MDMSKILRKAIEDSGQSRYRLAKMTGISEAVLSRFVNGKQSLTLPLADKLANVLGYVLIKKGK